MEKQKIVTLATLTAIAGLVWWLFKPRQQRGLPAHGRAIATPPRKRRNIREVVAAAFRDADSHDWTDYAVITPKEADAIRSRTGSALYDFTGWHRTLVASEVRKILKKHAADARPVKESDFLRLADMLSNPVKQALESRDGGKLDVLVSTIQADGQTVIVEEIRRGKQRRKLALLSIYRP